MHSHIHIHCLGTTNSKEDLLNMGGGGRLVPKMEDVLWLGDKNQGFQQRAKIPHIRYFKKRKFLWFPQSIAKKKLYKLTIGMSVSFPHMSDRSVYYLPIVALTK